MDVPMNLVSGTNTDGVWQGSYTPIQGGLHSFRILAHADTNRSSLSPAETFTVIDGQPPLISPPDLIDPILLGETQLVAVTVTEL
jgi:hypothetical protein